MYVSTSSGGVLRARVRAQDAQADRGARIFSRRPGSLSVPAPGEAARLPGDLRPPGRGEGDERSVTTLELGDSDGDDVRSTTEVGDAVARRASMVRWYIGVPATSASMSRAVTPGKCVAAAAAEANRRQGAEDSSERTSTGCSGCARGGATAAGASRSAAPSPNCRYASRLAFIQCSNGQL